MGTTSTPNPSSWLTIPERMGSEAEVLRFVLDQFAHALRVSIPGIVQSFNAAKQTVTVRPAILEAMTKLMPDGQGNTIPVPQWTPIPVLQDVPIMGYHGGGWAITLPIKAGDECWLLVSDLCINSWWATGGSATPPPNGTGASSDKTAVQEVKRRHDLSDCVAIFAPWSQPNALANYSTNSLQVRNTAGTIVIELTSSEINLTAPNVNINGQLNVSDDAIINTSTTSLDLGIHVHTGVTTGGGITGPPQT